MSSFQSKKISRRKFILFTSFTSLGFAIAYTNSNKKLVKNSEIKVFQNSLKDEIISFNQNRISQLKKNIQAEINKDHKNEKTIWIGHTLYTYAELSNLNN